MIAANSAISASLTPLAILNLIFKARVGGMIVLKAVDVHEAFVILPNCMVT